MDYWKCILNILVSYIYPFRSNHIFMLHCLAWRVPSLSHFLKLSRTSRARPLFHGRPRASLLGSLKNGVFN